jgi:signal transduction histidine kinase
LFVLRPGEHRFRNQPVAAPTPWTGNTMGESNAGTVWLDVGTELVPIAQNPPPVLPGRSSYTGPVFDHDGTLWDGTDGVRRIAHPELQAIGASLHIDDITDAYTDTDGLTSRRVFGWLVDREGNVWAATAQGLDRFSDPSVEAPLESAENAKVFPHVFFAGVVPADDAGGLWVTNGFDAVARYQDGRMSPPILRQEVGSLLRAADGTVWFGGRKALWRERQGHLESLTPPGPDFATQALALDKSGDLWASIVRAGVFRLKDGVWTPYGGVAALPRGNVITIVRDRRDRLWFSYYILQIEDNPGGNVAVLDGERVRTYGVADGLQIGNVMAIHPGRIGHWLGGDFGLARFDGKRFHSVRSVPELPLEGITGIVETADGDLWLNGGPGIVHLTAIELERSRLDPAYRVHGETLGAFDGVVGSGAVLRPVPTAIEAGDGKLWFATSNGIYGIDPVRRVHNRVPPPVLIRALTVGDRTLDPTPGLKLPVRTTAVRFDYIGLSLTAAEKVRYRYRLDGVDSDWRPLTASRQALYTNLAPGKYTFHVIAANNDGVWNDRGASLAFSIPPAFVQTGWFLALCVAGGALAVCALVRLRVRQVAARLRGRLEVRMAERERIARDLHDTLLQSTQGLIVRLQAQADRLAKGDPTRVVLEDALDRADETLAESRTRVHDLRASGEVPENLGEALARVAREQPGASEVEFSTVTEGTPRELSPAVADEIYSIGREALRNAFQHSRAKRIQLRLTYAQHGFGLSIRDDGVGLAADLVEVAKTGHFGLKGMKERAAKIGARLEIISAAPSGTVVTLTVPARVAYGPRGWLARLVDRWRSLPGSKVTLDGSVEPAQPIGEKSTDVVSKVES